MSKTWSSMLCTVLLLAGFCCSCSDDGETRPADGAVDQQQQKDQATSDVSSQDVGADLGKSDLSGSDTTGSDATGDATAVDYGNLSSCPIEKDLTTYVPCMCFTVVATAAEAKTCTKTYKCCPAAQKPVCE